MAAMGFGRFIARIFGKGAPPAPGSERGVRRPSARDRAFEDNRDVLAGLEFHATLSIHTPLRVLEHHGEVFDGPPSQAPDYGPDDAGCWIPKTKSWSELGIALKDPAESTAASEIGPIRASEYIPFLKAFRRIVEGDSSHDQMIAELESMPTQSASFRKLWKRLCDSYPGFPQSFFYYQLMDLPGVGEKTAQALYDAGLRRSQDVLAADDSTLLAIKGIGPRLVARLREGG